MAANRAFALVFAIALVTPAGVTAAQTVAPAPASIPKPPIARVRPVVDDYYGTKVKDNYRWMETPHSARLAAWMKAQDTYTRAVLGSIPGRAKLLARIRQLSHTTPRYSAQRLPGNVYMLEALLPGEQFSKLYVRRGLQGENRLVMDPATVRLAASHQEKGANAVDFAAVSQNGQYVAVSIYPGGSERDTEIHVFDTATGRETGDVISRVANGFFLRGGWLGQKWLPDNRSFVYTQLQKLPPGTPPAELEQKVTCRLHVLGTNSQNDPVIFGYGAVPSIHVDPWSACDVRILPDSKYVVGVIYKATHNSQFYIEPADNFGKTNSAWRKVSDFSDDVRDIAIHNDDLYVLTYKNALRYKVLRTDAHHPDLASAETVVPPSNAVVEGIHAAQDALYVQLLDGGIGRVLRVPYGAHPHIAELAMPFKGRVQLQTDPRLPGALIFMTSWTRRFTVYSYDPATNQLADAGFEPVGAYDDPSGIAVAEVKVRSYDGTLVPLSIVYPKTMKLDGSNPTWLYGYGWWGVSVPPFYRPSSLAWYEQGGIWAICHVRGGGEYGEEWHEAGKGPTKPNTWRDFIACAQYLIRHKYTSPARLAGEGASGGGILIGRAITTRPDLFAAAIDNVGLSDMLRFETTAHGAMLVPEAGSVKTKAGFKALYAMSSYAHIKDGTKYPAVLFMTGTNDPRVPPWEMAKMAARMQAATASGKPVLLRVNYSGGHSLIGATRAQATESLADRMTFLLWQLGVPAFQPHH